VPTLSEAIELYVELGRIEEAKAVAAELRSRFSDAELAARPAFIRGFVGVADVLGMHEEARRMVEAAPEQSRWRPILVAIHDGRLVAAADELAEVGDLESEARMRLYAAKRLAGEGRRAEADAQLQRAISFYRRAGAPALVQQAEALLTATA
jgi:hypothetical protein